MNRIVLIGNGFDLAHGLHTSYKDFINWYCDQRVNGFVGNLTDTSSDMLCTFQDMRHQVWNVNAFTNGYNLKHAKGKDIIDHIIGDENFFKTTMVPFFANIFKSIETKGWVDIENEYYNLLMRYSIDDYSEKNIKDLNQQLQFLQDKLIQYLGFINQITIGVNNNIWKKIYSPIDPKEISIEKLFQLREYIDWCVKQDNSYWGDKMLRYGESFSPDYIDNYKMHYHEKYYTGYPRPYMLPDHIMLLSFNYTKTAHLYHNQNIFLNYIHGDLENPQNIIFGYGDEIDNNYQTIKNLNDNNCLRNMKTIKYLETDNYRNALGFMDSDSFQVYIMGHSCGNSDRTLLNTMFEHKNCISIKPYYYKKEDGTDNYLELVQNISRNFTDMKLMRDRVVNKTYCETLTD